MILNSFPGDAIQINGAIGAYVLCSFIGTDATGTMDYGNGGSGILVHDTSSATIGNPASPYRGNLISANAISGVTIDAGSSNVVVADNYIGTDVTGNAALGNFNGVVVRGSGNLIGGANRGNLISGNNESGVLLDVPTATGNAITSNKVGSNAANDAALSNFGAGVYLLNGASNNVIGTVAMPNVFRANGANGVYVFGATTINNSIRGNSIFDNGDIGIDLGDFFENPNDPGDPDSGSNRLQNTPELVDVSYAGGLDEVTAIFWVSTDPANATYPLDVDFYIADADEEEGKTYLGTLTYDTTDFATGMVTKSFTPANTVAIGNAVVATATDAAGNTSEFNAVAISVVPEPAAIAAGGAALLALIGLKRRG